MPASAVFKHAADFKHPADRSESAEWSERPAPRQNVLVRDEELLYTRADVLMPVARAAAPDVVATPRAAGRRLVWRIAAAVRTWRDRAHGRRLLAAMDPRLRQDIGLSVSDVWREVNEPFWQR